MQSCPCHCGHGGTGPHPHCAPTPLHCPDALPRPPTLTPEPTILTPDPPSKPPTPDMTSSRDRLHVVEAYLCVGDESPRTLRTQEGNARVLDIPLISVH